MSDESDAATELAAVRAVIEEFMTANPGDTTLDLALRARSLSWPEGAASRWFSRWQAANLMNGALRKTLADLLVLLDDGQRIGPEQIAEAWAVLADVQTILPTESPAVDQEPEP